jgi:hypothetical protein
MPAAYEFAQGLVAAIWIGAPEQGGHRLNGYVVGSW